MTIDIAPANRATRLHRHHDVVEKGVKPAPVINGERDSKAGQDTAFEKIEWLNGDTQAILYEYRIAKASDDLRSSKLMFEAETMPNSRFAWRSGVSAPCGRQA